MTSVARLEWHPGSFTKNFGWGAEERGLSELHSIIRIGFANEVEDTSRNQFRERVRQAGKVDYIPINFFLFNARLDGRDTLVADELVFQAINFRHSKRFDKLALFAFNLSLVGSWRGAEEWQRRPALWSHFYVVDRLADELNWDTKRATANDIERFVLEDPRYVGRTGRKLATNLAYLYRLGRLSEFAQRSMDRWWVDCVFLALDRILLDRQMRQQPVEEAGYQSYLSAEDFGALSGKRSTEKDLALPHLIALYRACGGQLRFSPEAVRERTEILLPDIGGYVANDESPIAAIHKSNPSVLKSLPRTCAMLARYVANFEIIDWDEIASLDVTAFVKQQVRQALEGLRSRGVRPSASAEDVLRLLRDSEE